MTLGIDCKRRDGSLVETLTDTIALDVLLCIQTCMPVVFVIKEERVTKSYKLQITVEGNVD